MSKQILIDPLSGVSLFLERYVNDRKFGYGTGFIVGSSGESHLITSYHVLSGRDPSTNKPLSSTGAIPDTIGIWHHLKGKLGSWILKTKPLYNPDGSPRWLNHPDGTKIDVVALPITTESDVDVFPLDLALANTDLVLSPAEPISIIGFPFGFASAGKFPIWKTGHIASDIDLDYDGLPVFIIDATTKPGMSGAPVFARRIGMYHSSKGINMGGSAIRFLGIYSGRIHKQADIGMVWRSDVITSILK